MRIELFNAAFWGVILIIIGILIVIKHLFNIHFPIGRIVIAILFIYFGLRLLIGHHGSCCWHMKSSTENSAAFTEQQFHYTPNQDNYSCAFGSCSLDISDIAITENKTIEISSVFGEFRLKINKDANFAIHSNTAFGSTVSPDNSSYGFGQRTYYSPNYKPDLPHLTIKTNVAFGSIKIINRLNIENMKLIINTAKAPAPIGPYNQAVIADNTLYISGQIPINLDTNQLVTQSIKAQTTQVMENLRQILREANMDFSNVVKTSIFITDLQYFNEINEVYGTYFSKNFPARETVQVSKLPKNVDLEISMIAVK